MTSSDQHKIDVNSEIVETQPFFEQTHLNNNNYDVEKVSPHNGIYHKLSHLKTDYYKNEIGWHDAMPQVN